MSDRKLDRDDRILNAVCFAIQQCASQFNRLIANMSKLILSLALLVAVNGYGQLVTTGVGNSNLQSGFSESFGVDLSLRGNNFVFQQGGGPLLPAFGPPINPSRIGIGGPGGGLSIFGGQSSSRSITSQSASVTSLDGTPGSIVSQQLTPFVTGLTPVVGSQTGAVAAARGETLRRISESQLASRDAKLRTYLRRAERAQESGNLRMARANYRLAFGLANFQLKQQIQNRVENLSPSKK